MLDLVTNLTPSLQTLFLLLDPFNGTGSDSKVCINPDTSLTPDMSMVSVLGIQNTDACMGGCTWPQGSPLGDCWKMGLLEPPNLLKVLVSLIYLMLGGVN